MRPPEHDVVVVGAGVAGAILAERLSGAGLDVLVLEAGPDLQSRQHHIQQFYGASAKVPSSPWAHGNAEARAPSVLDIAGDTWRDGKTNYMHQIGDLPFASTYERLAGGTGNHWQGITPRMVPNDFRLKETYGQGCDWPLSYDDLQCFYTDAEFYMGVAGDFNEWNGVLGANRCAGFPMPAMPLTFLDHVLKRRLRGVSVPTDVCDSRFETDLKVLRVAQSRNSIGWDGRPPCMGNTNCIPICPIDAKYSPSIHLRRAQAASGTSATIRSQAVAYRIEVGKSGCVTGIHYRTWPKRTDCVAVGRHYVLAANAIETPKLLLMSPWKTKKGSKIAVGNSSDQVGRNLMDHVIHLAWGLVDEPVYSFRGPLRTGTITEFRDGIERQHRAAWVIAIANTGWGWAKGAPNSTVQEFVKKGLYGSALRRAVSDHLSRQVSFTCEFEQLPKCKNRVRASRKHRDALGIPKPEISYSLSDYEKKGFLAASHAMERIFRAIGKENTNQCPTGPASFAVGGKQFELRGAGHIMGTTRMGIKHCDSVVDPELRCHDHPNLWIAGGSVMPTVGTSNPTLTIAALTLRLAKKIGKELGKPVSDIPRTPPPPGQRAASGGAGFEES